MRATRKTVALFLALAIAGLGSLFLVQRSAVINSLRQRLACSTELRVAGIVYGPNRGNVEILVDCTNALAIRNLAAQVSKDLSPLRIRRWPPDTYLGSQQVLAFYSSGSNLLFTIKADSLIFLDEKYYVETELGLNQRLLQSLTK